MSRVRTTRSRAVVGTERRWAVASQVARSNSKYSRSWQGRSSHWKRAGLAMSMRNSWYTVGSMSKLYTRKL